MSEVDDQFGKIVKEKTPCKLNEKLSHKQWRRYLKKMRRREHRQEYARRKEREEIEEERRRADDEYYKVQSKVEARRKEEEDKEREREHQEWLQREKEAIDQIKLQKEEEERRHQAREEADRQIRDEWEKKEREEEEKKASQEALLNNEMENLEKQQHRSSHFGPPYQNPNAQPQPHLNQQVIPSGSHMNPFHPQFNANGENMDQQYCKFYYKTGACRFGKRCSRIHLVKEDSPTIVIQNFFQDARLAIPMINERSNDASLEYDEVDVIVEYEKFYDDVIGEFRAAGNVVMFKCCQNFVPHLRGNVYVQYQRHDEAVEAMKMFNGRYYGGRQLSVELSPVTNWRSSICGLFDKRLCPRGKSCNFLHVFRNPGNAYSVPNRTDFDPERARRQGGFDPAFINLNHPVLAYYNQRDSYGYRSEASIRSTNRGRNKWDSSRHDRSRSRDRKRRRRSHSRSRSYTRSRSRSYSSRSRSRSSSRDRSRKRSRRSRSRTRSRSKSKDRSKRSRKHSHSSDSSRGSKRSRKNSSEISDTSTDWSDLSDD